MHRKAKITTKKLEAKSCCSIPKKQKPNSYLSTSSELEHIIFLQRTIGNQSAQRVIKSGGLQSKLKYINSGGKYEQKAGRIEKQIMRMPETIEKSQKEEMGGEQLQGKASMQRQIMVRQSEPEEEQETIQPKLNLGAFDDEYEREANQAADTIVTMQDSRLQEQSLYGDKEKHASKRQISTTASQNCNDLQGKLKRSRSRGMVVPNIQLLRAQGLSTRERNFIINRFRWLIHQLTQLERNGYITSDEAERYRDNYSRGIREARDLARRRETSRSGLRQFLRRGRRLTNFARNVRRARRQLMDRARFYRGTSRPLTLLSQMTIVPRTIRVHEGETSRISFILRVRAITINWYIVESEGAGELTGRMGIRQFLTRNNDPGYKYAYWDGTFPGSRNRPPETRTYRVRLTVTDMRGRSEGVADQIRVENPQNRVVHPRHGSSYALASLVFNGSQVILSDDHGNQIAARAVSGLKPNHRRNPRHVDYTNPRYQWRPSRGPIPEGRYTITPGQVQQPRLEGRQLRYAPARGATAAVWGVGRITLMPYSRANSAGVVRSGFYFHVDVGNDGTAGCIGVHPGDVGKFNSMVSLIRRSSGSLNVIVRY